MHHSKKSGKNDVMGHLRKSPSGPLCQLSPIADARSAWVRVVPIPDLSKCSELSKRSGRDARFTARPPPRSVRAAFPHTAPASGV